MSISKLMCSLVVRVRTKSLDKDAQGTRGYETRSRRYADESVDGCEVTGRQAELRQRCK